MYSGNTKLIAETRHARPGNAAPIRPPFYTLVDYIYIIYICIYIDLDLEALTVPRFTEHDDDFSMKTHSLIYMHVIYMYYVCASRLTITAESFTHRKCHKPFPRDFLYICFIHVRRYNCITHLRVYAR